MEYEYFGEVRREELKPGGARIAVTAANRAEFVALMTDHYLTASVAPMFSTFSAGFHEARRRPSLCFRTASGQLHDIASRKCKTARPWRECVRQALPTLASPV